MYALLVINLILSYTRASWVCFFAALFVLLLLTGRQLLRQIIKPHLLLAFILLFTLVLQMPDVTARSTSAALATKLMIVNYAESIFGTDKVSEPEQKNVGSVPNDPTNTPKNGQEEQNTNEAAKDNPVQDTATTNQVVARSKLWKTAFMMFKDNYILGVGIGNYSARYQEYVERYPELNVGHDFYSAHNSFLKIMAETGTLGIIAYLFIYLGLFYQLTKYYLFFRKKECSLSKVLLMGFMAGSVAYLLQNNTNNLIFIPQQNIIFWMFAALILNYVHKEKEYLI